MSSFRTSDGVTLNYVVEGAGPTVVLVSGYGAPAVTWHFQREGLVAAGFEVVTLDRRHTGDSEFPAFGKRMSRQGADVHEFLESLDRPVGVVGHSMGASALYAMFDTFGTGGVSRACVVDQTPRMVNEGDWGYGYFGLTWETVRGWVDRFPEGTEAFHQAPPPEVLAFLAGLRLPAYPFAELRPLLLDHAAADWRDVLPRIDIPLLVMGGRHSQVWPVEHASWCAEAAPLGQLAIFEDSGHAPPLSEPDLFNQTLVDFFR